MALYDLSHVSVTRCTVYNTLTLEHGLACMNDILVIDFM